MATGPPDPPFTSADASATLAQACSLVGLDSAEAQLIRLGENAIYRLDRQRVVVRIARGIDVLEDARKEVAVASWLNNAGLPAAEPTEHDQPIVIGTRPVTFWKLIDNSGNEATTEDLARVLRQLHNLPVPASLALPEFDIFGRVAERIAASADITGAERDFLTDLLRQLRDAYADLNFTLPRSAVHGDAHQDNLIQRPDGKLILIDFERFAFGPPESDLAVTATERLVGWHSAAQYARFCQAYGFDVMTWEGFPVLRATNELKMTTWLMQNIRESDLVAQEFRTRLASLHDNDALRTWQPF